MKILHFCPSQSFSGLEQYALEMALYQAKRGHSVCMVVHPGSPLEKKCLEAKMDVLQFNYDAPFESLKFLPKLRRKLAEKFDVIHLHSTQDVARFFMYKNVLRGFSWPKTILQIHLWINHAKIDPWHYMLYSCVDEIWCASTPARDRLKKLLPVNASRIKIVNYGREVSKMQNSFLFRDLVRGKWSIPIDAIVFGTVNRFEKSKGLEEFFDAGLELLKRFPKLHLVFIGGPSPFNVEATLYHKKIMTKYSELSDEAKSRIHMLGMIPDSYQYLKAFDVYVLPSYEECFSLSLLDAQFAELPVLGTNSGGTPEVVVEGKTGWLFKPQSVDDLKRAMEKVLTHQSSWKDNGLRAANRVRKEFNQQQIFEEIIKDYGK